MQDAFHYIALGFAVLFVAKMVWLGWLAYKDRLPDPAKGEVSGWGAPEG